MPRVIQRQITTIQITSVEVVWDEENGAREPSLREAEALPPPDSSITPSIKRRRRKASIVGGAAKKKRPEDNRLLAVNAVDAQGVQTESIPRSQP